MTMNKMLSCLLVVSALTFFALPAFAGRPDSFDCKALEDTPCLEDQTDPDISGLRTLCEHTEEAESLKTRDRNGLIGKVLSASGKLDVNKVSDAEGKLSDYEDKLNALYDPESSKKPKITHDDFVQLLKDVLDAQTCVAGLL